MARYYGYYSNAARGKRKKAGADDTIPCITEPEQTDKAFRKNWAQLIQKPYEVDPLMCPKCAWEMRVVAFFHDEDVIRKIFCAPESLGYKTKTTPASLPRRLMPFPYMTSRRRPAPMTTWQTLPKMRQFCKKYLLTPQPPLIKRVSTTPHGEIVSPILANVYLYYALDLWFEKKNQTGVNGKALIVRYADDFVCAFQYKRRCGAVLPSAQRTSRKKLRAAMAALLELLWC